MESCRRDMAKSNLIHYFRMAIEANGGKLESDNITEIREIVDLIIDAAKEELRDDIKKSL